ncbi:hypothetical protein [Salinimicrobium gaetbulicola]|uniref:DUF4843 domain-containing protein n=1 Tax=Salinimicrobium gaetbulicola TaxID=999702 RepID=A0ABW3IIZ0_9FLAO
MKKYLLLIIAVVSLTFVGCNYDDEITEPNYVTFEFGSPDVGIDENSSRTYDVKVFAANVVGSDRVLDVTVSSTSTLDAGAYSVPATVTIPANSNEGVLTVSLEDVNVDFSSKTLILNLLPQSGLTTGDPITLNVRQVCPVGNAELKVAIDFDNWASEISWSVTNSAGDTIASGSGYADGDDAISSIICVTAGDYTFTINDIYGDGLGSPGGSATVSVGTTTLGSVSNDFGSQAVIDFTITDVRTE